MTRSTNAWVLSLWMALGLLGTQTVAFAQDTMPTMPTMPVPAELQAAIFAKIFTYCFTLQQGGAFSVLIVSPDDGSWDQSSQALQTLRFQFERMDLSVSVVSADQALKQASASTVIYLLPGTGATVDGVKAKGALTISGVPEYARKGHASVGLDLVDNKPKIVVHLKSLKDAGHEISSTLLRLAEVIK